MPEKLSPERGYRIASRVGSSPNGILQYENFSVFETLFCENPVIALFSAGSPILCLVKILSDLADKFEVLELPEKKYDVLVLMNTYQSEGTIYEALKSIDNQSFSGTLALLIHDDASTDNTREIISEFISTSRMKVFRAFRKINSFRAEERYTKWHLVQTLDFGYLALCDGDDAWVSKNKLSVQFNFLDKCTSAALSYHGYEQGHVINSEDNVDYFKRLDRAPAWLQKVYSDIFLPVGNSTVMYKKTALDTSNIDLIDKYGVGDMVHLWSALQHGSAIYVPGIRTFYRSGGSFNRLSRINQDSVRDSMVVELSKRLSRRTAQRLLITTRIKGLIH